MVYILGTYTFSFDIGWLVDKYNFKLKNVDENKEKMK